MQKSKSKILFFMALTLIVAISFSCKVKRPPVVLECDPASQTFEAEKNKKCDLFKEMNYVNSDMELKFDSQLVQNKPILLVIFNPGCSHCKELCKEIRDSIDRFNGANILYLTGEPNVTTIGKFAKDMELKGTKNFIVAADNSFMTTQIFEYKGIPQIMMYDKKRRLQHIYYKNAKLDDILFHLSK